MAKLKQLCLGLKESEKTLQSWCKSFKLETRMDDDGQLILDQEQTNTLIIIHHLLREREFTINGAKKELQKAQVADKKEETLGTLKQLRSFMVDLKNNLDH